eukprot:COSAG01_NODE_2105_length_8423_cov_6.483409_7_plen_105_part_00
METDRIVGEPQPLRRFRSSSTQAAAAAAHCNIIEAPWLVNGGHGASLRHHKHCLAAQAELAAARQRVALLEDDDLRGGGGGALRRREEEVSRPFPSWNLSGLVD